MLRGQIAIEETRRSRKDGNYTRIVAVKSDLKAEVAGKTPAPGPPAKENEGKSGANASHRTLTIPPGPIQEKNDRQINLAFLPSSYPLRGLGAEGMPGAAAKSTGPNLDAADSQ